MRNTLRCHALLHIQFFKHQTDTFNTLSFLHEVVTIEHCYRFPLLCRDDRFSHPATHRLLTEDATLRFHDKVEHSVAFITRPLSERAGIVYRLLCLFSSRGPDNQFSNLAQTVMQWQMKCTR